MRALERVDGTITVSGASRAEHFNRMWAGIGWPDREPGYLCVVGERTDGRYHALWEKKGGLWELGDAALEAKERFLTEYIWVDDRDALAASYLRTLDGLCFSDEKRPGSVPDEQAALVREAVPRATDPAEGAIVAPVQERVATNYRSALEKTRAVIMAGRLLVHETHCPVLTYTLRQPLDDLIKSPVMRGLVWVVIALEEVNGNGSLDLDPPDPWYANVPRGGALD